MTKQLHNYKEGDKIQVRHICTPNLPGRTVTYENGGIRVDKHWFKWEHFFEVNFIEK